ncbi:S26 family signal peptidase [Haloprofundus marisrubri]|uniref:S26 family signal peptidase n=1 Tax=Haloprofundus marisrubri TaxID=1514971 RepID=A0A0W1R755_9EURY|nr:S26 family signal peptidase [Haloprofundus marisrubri]KTG09209.1 S26 family signal peptidase [Haloprofundus marisrubri]
MSRSLLSDILQPIAVVTAVFLLLVVVSGVWPPMVAIESGSMDPNMQKGDMVVITATDRFSGGTADAVGVVTTDDDGEYQRFVGDGDVIIYNAPNRETPIIHRARFRVEAGENWFDRANESFLPAGVDSCEELRNCPAPYDGYVTMGDANGVYDQAKGIAPVVKEEWVRAKAGLRIPCLGWLRLVAEGSESVSDVSCW